jgi:DNA-binding transcriptional regulator YiaG
MTTPTPEQVRPARAIAGMTQAQAATVLSVTIRAWQYWEADTSATAHRAMSPALYELFLLKTAPRAD